VDARYDSDNDGDCRLSLVMRSAGDGDLVCGGDMNRLAQERHLFLGTGQMVMIAATTTTTNYGEWQWLRCIVAS
jgi:hypothetical protein